MSKIEQLRAELARITNPSERKSVILKIQAEHNKSLVDRSNKEMITDLNKKVIQNNKQHVFNQAILSEIAQFVSDYGNIRTRRS